MSPSTVVRRIAKIHAKAESAWALGLEHEARTSERLRDRLLDRHGLRLRDVLIDAEDSEVGHVFIDPREYGHEPAKKPAELWLRVLSGGIGNGLGVAAVGGKDLNVVGFVGKPETRDRAALMFVRLVRRLDEASREALAEPEPEPEPSRNSWNSTTTSSSSATTSGYTTLFYFGAPPSGPRDERWRRSWLLGAAHTIAKRLEERREVLNVRLRTEHALVPPKITDDVRRKLDEMGADEDGPVTEDVDREAARRGARSAADIALEDERIEAGA